jgi:hypothetical protein
VKTTAAESSTRSTTVVEQAVLAAAEALCASRPTRAIVALVVLLVLAAGGGSAPASETGSPIAGDTQVCDASVRPAPAERRSERWNEAVPPPRQQPCPPVRPRARWIDLRSGGLAQPRAPDAAT